MNSFYVSKVTKRKRVQNFLLLTFVILALGMCYYVIVKFGYGLHCPFYRLFHFECPFCGLTRMCVAIIEFRILKAFHYNPVAYTLLPVIAVLYLRTGLRYIKTGIMTGTEAENRLCYLMLLLMLVFAFYRNLAM